jgi:hypothetical protein
VRRDLTASISTVSSSWTAVRSAVQEVRYGTVHAQLKMSKTKTFVPATESCRHLPPQGGYPPDLCRSRSQALPPHFCDSEMLRRRRYLTAYVPYPPSVEQSTVDARLLSNDMCAAQTPATTGEDSQVGRHSRGPPTGHGRYSQYRAVRWWRRLRLGCHAESSQIAPGSATPYAPRVADALGTG